MSAHEGAMPWAGEVLPVQHAYLEEAGGVEVELSATEGVEVAGQAVGELGCGGLGRSLCREQASGSESQWAVCARAGPSG